MATLNYQKNLAQAIGRNKRWLWHLLFHQSPLYGKESYQTSKHTLSKNNGLVPSIPTMYHRLSK